MYCKLKNVEGIDGILRSYAIISLDRRRTIRKFSHNIWYSD